MVKITGDKRHLRRLRSAHSAAFVNELGKRVFEAADKVRTEAQVSIVAGTVQGEKHVPSKPGEAPNKQTGNLSDNIYTRRTGPLSAVTESSAKGENGEPVAVFLEYGTSKMEERPYMRPATAKVRENFKFDIRAAVNAALRKG